MHPLALTALRDRTGRVVLTWGPDELRVHTTRVGATAAGFDAVVLTADGLQDPQHRLEASGVREVIRCSYLDRGDAANVARMKSQVLRCAPQAAELVRHGLRVLVLCAAGENRSAIMTARIRHLVTGEAGTTIVADMRAQPRVEGRTFSNGVFRRWAESWPAFDASNGDVGGAKATWLLPLLGVSAAAAAVLVATVALRGAAPQAATANRRRRRRKNRRR